MTGLLGRSRSRRPTTKAGLALALAMAGLLAGAQIHSRAADYQAGSLKISGPWARATPKGAQVGGGYMTVTNTGSAVDKLVGGSLDAAGRVEIHEMAMENGIMRMHPVPDGGLEIKPGQIVTLKPGGYHVMFMDLKAPLKEGEAVKGTLVFEKAGSVPVEFAVQGLAAQSPAGGHSPDMKGMKGM